MEPTSRLLELQTLPFGFAGEILQASQRGVLMVARHEGFARGRQFTPDLQGSHSRLIVILADCRFSSALADLLHRSALTISNGILQAMAATAQETVSGLGSTRGFGAGKR
jgi:hypothetical protein